MTYDDMIKEIKKGKLIKRQKWIDQCHYYHALAYREVKELMWTVVEVMNGFITIWYPNEEEKNATDWLVVEHI